MPSISERIGQARRLLAAVAIGLCALGAGAAPALGAPVASFSTSMPDSAKPKRLRFDATASTGNIATYSWDFDDATSGTGAVVEHAYASSGHRVITLTV